MTLYECKNWWRQNKIIINEKLGYNLIIIKFFKHDTFHKNHYIHQLITMHKDNWQSLAYDSFELIRQEYFCLFMLNRSGICIIQTSTSMETLIHKYKNIMKMVTYGNIGTLPFVYSLVPRNYTVLNVIIDILMIKPESSWQRVRY